MGNTSLLVFSSSIGNALCSSQICTGLGEQLWRHHDHGIMNSHSFNALQLDLGKPLETLFKSFDPRPIAAASLGQVRGVRGRTQEFGSWDLVLGQSAPLSLSWDQLPLLHESLQ